MKQFSILLILALSMQVAIAQPRKGDVQTDTKGSTSDGKGGNQQSPKPSTDIKNPSNDAFSPRPKTTLNLYPKVTEANVTPGTGSTAPVTLPKTIVLPKEIKQEDVKPVIVKGENGSSTNWTENYIEAVGKCFIDRQKFTLPGQAEDLCKTGAEVMARRNLLIQIEKVRIIDTVTLINEVFDRQVTKQILDGYIRNAYRVGEYKVTNDYVEVTMRMNLRDGDNSVAEAATKVLRKAIEDGGAVAGEADANIDAKDISQAIAQGGYSQSNPLMMNIQQEAGAQPSLFPTLKFITEDGKELMVSTAPILGQIKGADQAMSYIKLGKDILKQMNIKGYNVIDGILNQDGSVSINLKNQPKAGKFFEILKRYGGMALKFLPMVLALI